MLKQFEKYIPEQSLLVSGEKVLLAVSGGIDSVVMTQLFAELNEYEIGMAHCNFQLRGTESDEDQVFVKDLATKLDCEFFNTRFETSKYASENSISIQMAARDLRYEWFAEIAEQNGFDKIAVAHNKNDLVETVLLNLVRGTGIKGLSGISAKSGIIIRPILFASRNQIEEHAHSNGIAFREDKSNSDTKYKRNFLRYEVIPLLEKINPSINETIVEETEIFESVYKIYSGKLESLKEAIVKLDDNRTRISIAKLKSLKISPPVLFDILSDFGFGYDSVKAIYKALDAEPGKRFLSDDYVLLKDRNELILEQRRSVIDTLEVSIRKKDAVLTNPFKLTISTLSRTALTLPRSNTKVAIDKDKLKFPLKLRKWQKGDFFIPLGMKGRKKLSDFFVDRKIDRLAKDKVWVLTSGKQIVWVVGHQIDERFKITESTSQALLLELIN